MQCQRKKKKMRNENEKLWKIEIQEEENDSERKTLKKKGNENLKLKTLYRRKYNPSSENNRNEEKWRKYKLSWKWNNEIMSKKMSKKWLKS